ncbi:MAG: HD-GYP domain-containing protein [Chitinophagales bacterium]
MGGANKNKLIINLFIQLLFITLVVYISLFHVQSRYISLACICIVCIGSLTFTALWLLNQVFKPIQGIKKTACLIMSEPQPFVFHEQGEQTIKELASALNDFQQYYQNINQEIVEKLIESEEMFIQMIFTINAAVEAKDHYTSGHSAKVAEYARAIVEELEIPQEKAEKIVLAAQLHDVGKIGTSESILNKRGKLTEQEYSEIKNHSQAGRDILANSSALWDIIPSIYYHHERFDGTGYPEGLMGEEIPLGSRVISVADAFDAMTSDRPYRKAMSGDEALNILIKEKSKQFDPIVVDAFLRIAEKKENTI